MEVEGLEEYKYVRKYKDSSNSSVNTTDTKSVSVAESTSLSVLPNAQNTHSISVVSTPLKSSASNVNSSDDIEILLDEEEDFEANFDRYLKEMLEEEFGKIDVIPNNSVKKM